MSRGRLPSDMMVSSVYVAIRYDEVEGVDGRLIL